MDAENFRLRAFAQVLSIPSEAIVFDIARDLGSFREFAAAARDARPSVVGLR
jgi:hypothetical protein